MANGYRHIHELHEESMLMYFGLDERAARHLAVSLLDRPTREETTRLLAESEVRILRWLIPLLVAQTGALAAMLWRVFAG